jgi:sec-independent protein translocase protein TatC
VNESEPDRSSEEGGPGPRKTFWAHLEDLRKVLIRSVIAVFIALIVCLMIDDKLVKILEYPLSRMDMFEKPKPAVSFELGTTKLGPFEVTPDQFAAIPDVGSSHVTFKLGATKVGEEYVLTLKPEAAPPTGVSDLKVRLHNLGPSEGFFVAFHIAFYGALIISAPFWLFFIGQFILPALHVHERRVLFTWLGWGTFLFFTGVLLTYFLLLPVALRASVEYSELLGFNGYDWRADDYIGFVTRFLFGMGLGFQAPVIILILVKVGLLNSRILAKYRRHVCVASFILGAVLTTPEVITQVAMAVPLYVLYESCIWIAWYWERKKRKAEAETHGMTS